MQIPQFFNLFQRKNQASGWCCIALNERGAYIVQLKRSGKQIQVLQCEYIPLEKVAPLELSKLIKELRLFGEQFTTLLGYDEYQILMVDSPNVPPEELKTAIRFRIKDSLNYKVEDATVDVLQIPGSKISGNRPQSLYAVAASNETIQRYISLFEKAKLNLSVIDIPEMAQRNIAALFEMEERGLIMLTFDERGGLLTFTCQGELYLSRRLEITCGQLQDANENSRQQYFDRVELEVQRSLDYFDRQFHQVSLNRILVCAPEKTRLTELLANSLGLPVEKLDITQVMDISAVPALQDEEFLLNALPALGAALRTESRAL
ncbi:MAG: agglutinin biogenesis protein MshI [Gallionellaceae bacterium]|jgi:MSHA biogenesis protein MshI